MMGIATLNPSYAGCASFGSGAGGANVWIHLPEWLFAREAHVDCRVGLSMFEQLIKRETNISGDLAEQDRGNVPALMKRHRCSATCGIAKLFV